MITKHKILVSILLYLLMFFFSLSLGSSGFDFKNLIKIIYSSLTNTSLSEQQLLLQQIIIELRLPRIIVASITGAALAAAGVLSQGLFRNALASPSVLGISAGSTLTAALLFYNGIVFHNWLMLPILSFCGTLAITVVLMWFISSFSTLDNSRVLLFGFALNALLGALTSYVVSLMLADFEKAAAALHWLFGGFDTVGYEHIYLLAPWTLPGLWLAIILCRKLDILVFGMEVAQTLGIDSKKLHIYIVLCIALLVGTSTSIAGGIPFIGLMVPHFVRMLVGSKHQDVMQNSIFIGMSLLLFADTLARTLWTPSEIDVGILTALIGAPFLLFLLKTQGKNHAI